LARGPLKEIEGIPAFLTDLTSFLDGLRRTLAGLKARLENKRRRRDADFWIGRERI
jgi:hypothetical protein